jgi:hypothetical protein
MNNAKCIGLGVLHQTTIQHLTGSRPIFCRKQDCGID